jgi:hypothetical protein
MSHRVFAATIALAATLVPGAPAADPEPIQQAVSRGVQRLKELQAADGTWPAHAAGATALVGLTLLECDVPATDPAIVAAASYLRKAWPDINDRHTTYAIALTTLFLDCLGDPADVPIIQALGVRLLAGQNSAGGWSYECPMLGPDELRQLRSLLARQVELKTKAELPRPAARNSLDRPALPKEIRQILTRVEQRGPAAPGRLDAMFGGRGDNSNTQFAILGLWAARRHGIPVEDALARAATRFRSSQHADGGWGYMDLGNLPRFGGSTPSMTCAGLLGLALGFGSAREATLRTVPRLKSTRAAGTKTPPDPARDPAIRAGLAALGQAVGQPLDDVGVGRGAAALGDSYYLLWSVERVAMAYSLTTVGNKDWYAWGSQYLLAAQGDDGGWQGKFGPDVDTCFALLFLRRTNLSEDLTAHLRAAGSVQVTLKAGTAGGNGTARAGAGKATTVPSNEPPTPRVARTPTERSPEADDDKSRRLPGALPTASAKDAETEAARLGAELLKASGREQERLLEQLREAKGVPYTEALAAAIPQLTGTVKTKARDALAERLARMTPATLRDKLQDEAPEIRRAAALACAVKADKQFIPDLANLLEDVQPRVARAAHAALKDLTGQDLGPPADASPAVRRQAATAWKEWWERHPGR